MSVSFLNMQNNRRTQEQLQTACILSGENGRAGRTCNLAGWGLDTNFRAYVSVCVWQNVFLRLRSLKVLVQARLIKQKVQGFPDIMSKDLFHICRTKLQRQHAGWTGAIEIN